MNKRTIIVNSNCYHGFDVKKAVEGIAKAGFHHVELTATKGWTEHVFPSMSFSSLVDIRDFIHKHGLDVPSMSGHCNLMDDSRIRDFKDNIELAHFFGASIIVSSIGEAHLKDRATQKDEMVAENIRALLPVLERYEMMLVLETHGAHGTASRLKRISDLVASPFVKICYDTANAIFYGDVKGDEDILSAGGDIAYVHMKDKAGERTEWNFPALGEGYVDFPLLLSALDEKGSSAPLSVEIEFTQKGASSLMEVDEAVFKSGLYLQKLGYEL